jgi:group I intron endonuclease
MDSKQYYIYVTTNNVNGKKYVGKHFGDLNDDYIGSGYLLKRAIAKYGRQSFAKEIICTVKDPIDLDIAEKLYIEKFNAVNSDGFYNLASGGTGGNTLTNDEIVTKRTEKFHRYWNGLSIEDRAKISNQRSKNTSILRQDSSLEKQRIESFKKTIANRTPEETKSIYATRSGGNSYCARKVSTPHGVFSCAKDAAQVANVHIQTILNRCKNNNYPDWKFLC